MHGSGLLNGGHPYEILNLVPYPIQCEAPHYVNHMQTIFTGLSSDYLLVTTHNMLWPRVKFRQHMLMLNRSCNLVTVGRFYKTCTVHEYLMLYPSCISRRQLISVNALWKKPLIDMFMMLYHHICHLNWTLGCGTSEGIQNKGIVILRVKVSSMLLYSRMTSVFYVISREHQNYVLEGVQWV